MTKKEETVEKEIITRKVIKGKPTKKKKNTKKKSTTPSSKKNIEKILIENFVDFQRVMMKMSHNFETLSKKISDLIELFEDSAQVLVKKEIEENKDKHYSEEILDKMRKLLDQNKIIAKGLTLIHEKNLGMENEEEEIPRPPMSMNNSMMKQKNPMNQNKDGYSPSFMPAGEKPIKQNTKEIKFNVPGQEEGNDENPVFEIPG
ncbi:MAG: hypothetical protein KC516_04735 [Nanoarchaeota archaeon]|nr:hypothetical protein [Nanoarchaeota archaeon]